MARPLRVEFPGAWYHLTARGNERRAIFRSDQDRARFLELLGECRVRFDLRIHAYVLMSNHYHLIAETPQGRLSRALQWLNVSYTVWFNRRHGRSGHLFQGRFKGILLEVEEHGAALSWRNRHPGSGWSNCVPWLAGREEKQRYRIGATWRKRSATD